MKNFFILSLFILAIMSLFSGCSTKKHVMKHSITRHYTSSSRYKSTMRSYVVHGKRYTPTYVEIGQTMRGISSWYGPHFHGRYTSNGEIYNMHAHTAAHKTWPMDTMVRVRNLQNGKSTVVRINDRGPFVRGRIIDCSYAAGKDLGLDRMGIAKVSLEVIGFSGKIEPSSRIEEAKKSHKKIRVALSNFGIQVGAFRRYAGAEITKRNYIGRYERYYPVIKHFNVDGAPLYRVWLMGFGSEQEAEDFKDSHYLEGAFIVRN